MLNVENLAVESFATNDTQSISPIGGYCCTGCTSGCGINPTAGGCESNSGSLMCPAEPVLAAE